ncbi:MAG: glycosyltransferase family 4 protein [Acidimicrobiales bacterium]
MTGRAPLRVAMVMERFPNEPFLARQVAALLKRSVDVHVLCQVHDRTSAAWALLDDVDMTGRIHPWPDRGKPLSLAATAGRTMAAALVRNRSGLLSAMRAERQSGGGRDAVGRMLFDARVLAINPDVVHFQFGDLARNRIHLTNALDVAMTSSFRGYDLAYAGLDQPGFYDRLWPALHGAHTLGNDLRQRAVERGCPPEMAWTLIAPAIDPASFQAANRQPGAGANGGPVRIVSVGRLHWKKGLPDGLAAIAELVAEGHQVVYRIVGDGPAMEQVRWTIDDLGLGDRVELVGASGPSEVQNHLAWADIFLHPALTEGFANAVLEAQAMGLPVVCTDAEGLPENVAHERTGLVVPRRRPDLLVKALGSLVADEELRLAMGEQGRARVVNLFDLDAQTDAFIDFFERAVVTASAADRTL